MPTPASTVPGTLILLTPFNTFVVCGYDGCLMLTLGSSSNVSSCWMTHDVWTTPDRTYADVVPEEST